MLNDIRYALRSLRKHPGFTVVAVVTIAIGIGANTAMFSVINGVLLRALPYDDADRLVVLREVNPLLEPDSFEVSYPNFLEWQQQARAFDGLAAVQTSPVTLRGGDGPAERVLLGWASRDLFGLLGAHPVVGRAFTDREGTVGAQPVVLLTHRAWQSRFGGDPNAVGRVLSLSGEAFTVVGVLPRGFAFPDDDVQLWAAMERRADAGFMQNRAVHTLLAIGRLRADVDLDEAVTELRTIASRIQSAYPDEDPGHSVVAVRLLDAVVGDVRPALLVLFGAVGFVLLIACVNVADLVLSRAATRRREIAVRAALGAGRWRVVRLLLVESGVLAVVGGIAGIAVAVWGVDLLLASLPPEIPRADGVVVDGRVLGFTLALSVVAGLGFGLFPALVSAGQDLRVSLSEWSGSMAPAGARLRSALVVAQIAISLVLLAGAGLMINSLVRLQRVDPGFDPRNLLSMTVSLSGSPLGAESEETIGFYERLPERLEALPGVVSVSAVNSLPVSGGDSHGTLTIDGRPFTPGEAPTASFRRILPGYFRVMGIPLLQGRDFEPGEGQGEPYVVIISETMARRYWTDGDAVGSRIKVGPEESEPWLTVVGVARDVRNERLAAAADLATYEPHRQRPWQTMNVLVRTESDPTALIPVVRDEIRRAGSDIPVYDIATMPQRIAASLASRRFVVGLLALFAAIAFTLAAIGVYGVIAFSVAQRRREFGVRMALGAAQRDVARLVLRHGVRLTLIGTAFGLALALGLARALSGLLFQVAPNDPLTYGIAVLAIACLALAAAYIPARRAAQVDPVEALRSE
jgi:putative ABC transport system permease protein